MLVRAVRGRSLLDFLPVLANFISSSISKNEEEGRDTTPIAVGVPDKLAR